jgi:hypothetical protein
MPSRPEQRLREPILNYRQDPPLHDRLQQSLLLWHGLLVVAHPQIEFTH